MESRLGLRSGRAQLGATLTCLSRVRGQDDGLTDSFEVSFQGFRPPVSLVVAAVGGWEWPVMDGLGKGWLGFLG